MELGRAPSIRETVVAQEGEIRRRVAAVGPKEWRGIELAGAPVRGARIEIRNQSSARIQVNQEGRGEEGGEDRAIQLAWRLTREVLSRSAEVTYRSEGQAVQLASSTDKGRRALQWRWSRRTSIQGALGPVSSSDGRDGGE